jgi:hypothetical protein
MTFTELELLLGLAVGVLLWHISALNKLIKLTIRDREVYRQCIIRVGKGEGTIIIKGDTFYYEETNETKSISSI